MELTDNHHQLKLKNLPLNLSTDNDKPTKTKIDH